MRTGTLAVYLVTLALACGGEKAGPHGADAGGTGGDAGTADADASGPGVDAAGELVGSLAITEPADGATVSGEVRVAVSATGPVAAVAFELPGAEVETDDEPPFEMEWSSTAVFDGAYRIAAIPIGEGGTAGAPVQVAVTADNGNPAPTGWNDVTPAGPSPSPRRGHAMAYDSARDRIVLFGGYAQGSGYSSETWEWNGASWIDVSPPAGSPPARTWQAMAYDPARSRVILFGGESSSELFADSWTWDGSSWTEVTPAFSPSGRSGAAMAFDVARGRVVLFGGEYADGDGLHDDTWTWNGSVWAEEPLDIWGPRARSGHALAWDADGERVMMFGGHYGETDIPQLRDTWVWDGIEWSRLSSGDEICPLVGHAMAAYPPGVLLYGGTGDECPLDDSTWGWDGAEWAVIPTPDGSPGYRVGHAMAHDPARDQVVLFGGTDGTGTYLGQTWIFRRE